jgi:hypothetical protein
MAPRHSAYAHLVRPALRSRSRSWAPLAIALCSSGLWGCDEPAPKPQVTQKEAPAGEPSAAPSPVAEKPKSAPLLKIDELSPLVGYSRAMLTTQDGHENATGLSQLKGDLALEKEFISGQEVTLEVHRSAQPEWVTIYLDELFELGATGVVIKTESRPEYPKSIRFVGPADVKKAPSCSLVGMITEERGTAIWRASGGAARKRGRGLSGPDLSRTGDTIATMFKGCDSDLFVVHGAKGVEWGMIYDLAATGLSAKQSPLHRASLPPERPTPGKPL